MTSPFKRNGHSFFPCSGRLSLPGIWFFRVLILSWIITGQCHVRDWICYSVSTSRQNDRTKVSRALDFLWNCRPWKRLDLCRHHDKGNWCTSRNWSTTWTCFWRTGSCLLYSPVQRCPQKESDVRRVLRSRSIKLWTLTPLVLQS